MKNIKITCGTYGFRPGDGSRVVPINLGEYCEVPDEEAARLVSLGVAEYSDTEAVATSSDGVKIVDANTNTTDGNEQSTPITDGVAIPDTVDIVDRHFMEDSLRQMKNPNLAKLATDLGLDVSKCKVKDDYIAALMTVQLDSTVPENDDDTAVDDGESPPKFDDDSVVV